MSTEAMRQRWETLESEQLKSAAELGLHMLARLPGSETPFQLLRGGERVEDIRLATNLGSLVLENPLLVAAGWDKKGRAVDGLYELGFAGTEIGTVLPFAQYGNARPRMWYDASGAAYNRLGFNAIGQEAVADNLDRQQRPGVLGISLGKNKLLPDDQAPWAHATVAERLHGYADYFVINVSSPNTPGLRGLLEASKLSDIIIAVQEVLKRKGHKPLFVKTTVDLAEDDMLDVIGVCAGLGVSGIIDSNTTVDSALKAQYGWENMYGIPMGGVSGDVPEYRAKATARMKFITRESKGTGLQRIGVGAINSAGATWERMEAGAQAVQVMTAIRQHKAKVARKINTGLQQRMDSEGVVHISEIVGTAV